MLLFEFNVVPLTSIESLTPPPILNPLPTLLNDALCFLRQIVMLVHLTSTSPDLKVEDAVLILAL